MSELDDALAIIMRPGFGRSAEVHYTYTQQQEEVRAALIDLIEAEKRAYLERIEPYMQRLAAIHGKPTFIVNTMTKSKA